MPNYTPNLNLVKPLVTEQYDIAKVTNENADILDSEINGKQATLVSGTNIKTINGNSILGSGDIITMLPKNWIINGMFDVWQRGTSQTTTGYGSDDRWYNLQSGSTKTHSRQAFANGQTEVPNNPKYFSRTVVTTGGGTNSFALKSQRIEDVSKLAGKTVTVSFWAKADANKNMAIEFQQNFGTGGSVTVDKIGIQKFALTTTWQRFTKTITIPSVSGKTIGDGNFLFFVLWLDAGSDFNLSTDSLGNQSGTFDIANVSLVEGSVAVECQNRPYADVFEQCRRYTKLFVSSIGGGSLLENIGNGFAWSSTGSVIYLNDSVPFRVPPTVLQYGGNLSLATGAYTQPVTSITLGVAGLFSTSIDCFVASGLTVNHPMALRRNSDLNAYVLLSAEL